MNTNLSALVPQVGLPQRIFVKQRENEASIEKGAKILFAIS